MVRLPSKVGEMMNLATLGTSHGGAVDRTEGECSDRSRSVTSVHRRGGER